MSSSIPRLRSCAVIGAGIAGVTAARALADAGVDVTVFEKSRGAGGRTSTRRAAPLAFDHGAQYFTARDHRFRDAVRAWERAGVVAEWTGRIAVLGDAAARTDANTRRFVGVPGMSAVCKHAAAGIDVRYATRIESVRREHGAWALVDTSGAQAGTFDGVVVTAPPAQAVPLLAAAPRLSARAATVSMLPCWSVMVGFAQRLDVPFDGAFVHGSPLGWIARDSSKPGRPAGEAWILQASPEWSAAHVESAAADVIETLLEALARDTATRLPERVHSAAHRWMYARPDDALGVACLVDPEHGIAAAGDWCLGARVEAAFLSGRAAAEALLRTGAGEAGSAVSAWTNPRIE